jgi:hypothetical protein
MIARIGSKIGTKVIISRITSARCYYDYGEIFTNEFKPSKELVKFIIKKKLYKKIDGYLEKRVAGNAEQHDVVNAYRDKKYYPKEKLCQKLGLNSHFPIVFIMPHAFSDAPHSNEYMLFRDYYQWFIETVKYVNNATKNINWIIKPHPSSFMYGENGEVRQIIKKLKLDNIFLVPLDLSTASIFNITKTIITVSGTIGIESACFGIRPIIAGRSVYSGFGIAYEPRNKSDYFSLLKDIENIKYLNEQEIMLAKALFYWYQIGSFPHSEILPKKSFLPTTNSEFMREQKKESYMTIIKNLEENNPRDDPYYLGLKEMIKGDKKYLTTI